MPGKSLAYLAEEMTAPERLSLLGGEVVVFSASSPEKSTPNEDAAAVLPSGVGSGVLVVADGMGGSAAGEKASRIAIEAITAAVADADPESMLRTAILNGIETANRLILDLGLGAATTLAVLEILGDQVRPYHIGDASVLVVGQRGKVKLLTVAHSPVGLAVEAGVLDGEAAMSHEDRHLVTNVLGDAEMRIEIGPILRLAKRDTVVLATDGLFDNLTPGEIAEGVRRGPLLNGVTRIIELAGRRMRGQAPGDPSKPDDLTVIGYRVSDSA